MCRWHQKGGGKLRVWRNRHFLVLDLLLLPIAVYTSYVIRLDTFRLPQRWWPGLVLLTAGVMVATPLIFRRAGLYARMWRYASIHELLSLTGAWTLTVIAATALSWLSHRLLMG